MRNGRTIETLRQQCVQAMTPGLRKEIVLELYETELRALTNCICDGTEDAHDLEKGVVVASPTHYERLARELVEFVLLDPDDARRVLPELLKLMECVPSARKNEFKKKAGIH